MFKDYYGVIAILAIFCVVIFNFMAKKKEGKDWIYAVYFIVTLLIGTVLYSFAYIYNNDADTVFSPIFLILRSLSYSLKSFAGDFNSPVLSKLAKENKFYYAALITHYIAAVFLMYLVIIKYFGKNLINEIRVFLISWFGWFGKYIVIGCDGEAKIFLKNLEQKQRTIVIIQSDQIDKKKELIDKGYAVVAIKEIKESKKDKKKTNSRSKKKKDENDTIKAYSRALKKTGAMRCVFKTRVISMSEKDETNLLVAKIMADYINRLVEPKKENDQDTLTEEQKDKIKEKQEKKISKIKLDVRIMYSFLERAEHFSYIGKTFGKIRFFNTFEIRARKFLWENPITKLIPFHWIDTEKARLKSKYKISNIFVGFGSTNKAIFKESIINNQLMNIDYKALVICKDAKEQEKLFKNSAIGLFDTIENGTIIKRGAEIMPNPNGNVYLESPSEQNNIIFEKADALSAELYDLIINEIRENPDQNGKSAIFPNNYATVIIALGDNRLSIETALELRQKLYESDLLFGKIEDKENPDKEYSRVRIFVKIYEETILADEKILNTEEINCKIKPFGADEEILTEEYIIDEKLDTLAKNIANRYEGSMETATATNEWNTCTQFHRESNRYAAMAIRVKLNLLGFELIDDSEPAPDCIDKFHKRYDKTNTAFDLRAKRKAMEKIIKLAREKEKGIAIPDEIKNLKIEDKIIDLVERNEGKFADNARNNLAKLEHQRWNAFYLANDWTKLPIKKIGAGRDGRQNGAAKQHACITTFDGLIKLREMQKNAEKKDFEDKKNEIKKFIEAESLLNADTIRHDFNTMDFLLDLTGNNLSKMREAEEQPNKEYIGILTGSGYNIREYTGESDDK